MDPIPQNLGYSVDTEYWGRQFDPEDPNQYTPEIINGHIIRTIMEYRTRNYKDNELWNNFHEDYEGFTTDLWKLPSHIALRDLRDELITRGVWIDQTRGARSYAIVFQECLEQENPHPWTEDQIKDRQERQRRRRRNSPIQASEIIHEPTFTPSATISNQTVRPSNNIQQQQNQGTEGILNVPGTFSNEPRTIPPEQAESVCYPSKQLTDLMKIYGTDDNKYGGKEYDILDVKLRVFYDCCGKVGLRQEYFAMAFSAMLKGDAKYYYYNTLSGNSYGFDTMVQMIKTHFETEERRQKYLSDWRETTLQQVITQNPSESKLQCFQIMATRLQQTQRALPREYQSDLALRD